MNQKIIKPTAGCCIKRATKTNNKLSFVLYCVYGTAAIKFFQADYVRYTYAGNERTLLIPHYIITNWTRAVGCIGAYPKVLYTVPLGLGYAHAVCDISRINHTYSEELHPEYPPWVWFYPSAAPRRKLLQVHILLFGVVYAIHG